MKRMASLFAALAVALIMPLGVLANPPERPVMYWGNVKINGSIAPQDTTVTVKVGGIEVASAKADGNGKYWFNLSQDKVPVGSLMKFEINGKAVADAEGIYKMVDVGTHSVVQYDLAITTSNPPASGGGSSSGGGNAKPPVTDKEKPKEEPSEGIYDPEELEDEGSLGGDENGSVKGAENVNVIDGDIIQCKNSANPFAVYIVKIVNGKKYIRHIVSLEIFNYYQHLKWENLIQVESLDGYSLSAWVRVNTGPNGQAGPNDKVWEINGDQTKHWIDMTAEEFLLHGGSEEAIYSINQGELNLYKEGPAVKLM
jgi:hypothetical protein